MWYMKVKTWCWCVFFQNTVGRYHKPFQGYDQHDSHEFLIKLMDWVHEDLNKVRSNSWCALVSHHFLPICLLVCTICYLSFISKSLLLQITGKKPPMKEQNHDNLPDYVAADKVMEEIRRRDQSIVQTLFHGLHRSTIECSVCSHRSLTFEPFSIISLSFPSHGRCSLKVRFLCSCIWTCAAFLLVYLFVYRVGEFSWALYIYF